MLQQARCLHLLFVEDMAAFTAFDTSLNAGWAAEWAAEIDAAEDLVSDTVMRASHRLARAELNTLLAAARDKWAEVKYFAERAFADNRQAMLRVFGADEYLAARRHGLKMAALLAGMHTAATAHSAALIAEGYTQARIDDIAALRDALLAKAGEQQMARRGRTQHKAARIMALNAPYSRIKTVCRAAQMIYAGNEVKRWQYTFRIVPGKEQEDAEGGIVTSIQQNPTA